MASGGGNVNNALCAVYKKMVVLLYDLEEKVKNRKFFKNSRSFSKEETSEIEISEINELISDIKDNIEEIVLLHPKTPGTSIYEEKCNYVSFKDRIKSSLLAILEDTNSISKNLKKQAEIQRFERVYGGQETDDEHQVSDERDQVEDMKKEFIKRLDNISTLIHDLVPTRDSGFGSFSDSIVGKNKESSSTEEVLMAIQCEDFTAEGDGMTSIGLEFQMCERTAEASICRRAPGLEPTQHDETGS